MKLGKTSLLACLTFVVAVGCGGATRGDEDMGSSGDFSGETKPAPAIDASMVDNVSQAAQPTFGAAGAAAPAHPVTESTGAVDTAPPARVGRDTLGDTPLPCELRTVLATSCQSCHARSPGGLAPMALTSREDLLAAAISQPERRVFELMKERVHSVAAPMPPASSRRLTSDELATLDNLLSAEVAVGPEQCGGASAKRASFPAPDPSEIDQCYPFYAYDSSGDVSKPFRVPSGEISACFAFDIPWAQEAQALSVRIRTSTIVHHWRLFDQQLGLPQGTVLVTQGDCSIGATTSYAVVEKTDEKEINMPPGVGLEMPAPGSGLKMMLAVHYFNMGQAVDDISGAEVCVARKPREHTAGVHSVSNNDFQLPPHQATNVAVQCTPKYFGDIHIIQSLPHMHTRGTRMDTVVQRVDGSSETLLDVPFDFNNQVLYQTEMVLKPGDKLLTTCHYQNDSDRTISVGPSTEDEMCLNDITAWPAGSLFTGTSADGGKGCFQ